MQEAKRDGDTEPVPFWKEHNSECHTMHQKIDIIAAKLGFPFHLVDGRALECTWPWEKESWSRPMCVGVSVGVHNEFSP